MFVLAGLLWLNVSTYHWIHPANPTLGFPVFRYIGWPLPAIAFNELAHPDNKLVLINSIITNIIVALVATLSLAVLFEIVVRRFTHVK